jgi:hypothetical protein
MDSATASSAMRVGDRDLKLIVRSVCRAVRGIIQIG